MASYNTVITNEGAALLASVIANQGTLTFSEMRFSTTDYDGVEQTLTVGTFGGVFITAAAAGSVVDATTIKVAAQFDNSGIVGDHPLYSIGIVGTDGNTTALIAVCTTTNPDIIRAALTGVSTYAFNINLTVSSTNNITVVGTTAGVQYEIMSTPLVIDGNTETTVEGALGALNDYGDSLEGNIEAIVDVYGAKNFIPYPYYSTSFSANGITFTDNGDGSITASGIASADTYFILSHQTLNNNIIKAGDYVLNGCPNHSGIELAAAYYIGGSEIAKAKDTGSGANLTVANDGKLYAHIQIKNTANLSTPVTFYPMLRDARITDSTFVPYAKTNKQLTDDKAERSDLATLNLTGSTNTTGSTIPFGKHFYLNNEYCKAIVDIANNATFTENTNYKGVTVGEELEACSPVATSTSSVNDPPSSFKEGITVEGTYSGTDYPLNYGLVMTIKNTNNRVFQINFGVGATYIRSSSSPSAWNAWYSFTEAPV